MYTLKRKGSIVGVFLSCKLRIRSQCSVPDTSSKHGLRPLANLFFIFHLTHRTVGMKVTCYKDFQIEVFISGEEKRSLVKFATFRLFLNI